MQRMKTQVSSIELLKYAQSSTVKVHGNSRDMTSKCWRWEEKD